MSDLFELIDSIDRRGKRAYRPLLPYPGNKEKLADRIIDFIPLTARTYVEVFGGSGITLMMKPPHKIEVFNDRSSGICALYKCIQDEKKLDELIKKFTVSVYSREFWEWTMETWQQDTLSDVERAYRWYYCFLYSYGCQGRTFGRSFDRLPTCLVDKIPEFWAVNERLKRVQIENLDWKDCMTEYDDYDTVFYLDPPYAEGVAASVYTHDTIDHKDFLDTVFKLKGMAIVSGYSSPLYDNQPWDAIHSIPVLSTMKREGPTMVEEMLWIKEVK